MKKLENTYQNKIRVKSRRIIKTISDKIGLAEYDVIKFPVKKRVEIIDFKSPIGQRLFAQAEYDKNFFKLAPFFQLQEKPDFSPYACAASVINGFKARKNISNRQHIFDFLSKNEEQEYRFKTQKDIFEEFADGGDQISFYTSGLGIRNIKDILEQHEFKVDYTPAEFQNERCIDKLREEVKITLNDYDEIVICSFLGEFLGLGKGEHNAIVASYDADSDRALLLDCAENLQPWYWVSLRNLYFAMKGNTKGQCRGYLVASERF